MALVCHTNSRVGHVFITDCTRMMTMALECPPVDYCSYQVLQKSIITWFKIWNGSRARRHIFAISRDTLLWEEKKAEKKEKSRETDRQTERHRQPERGCLLAAISVMWVTYRALLLPRATATRTNSRASTAPTKRRCISLAARLVNKHGKNTH
jgi:hypothetical protein